MRKYKTIYKDKFGEEETDLLSDGSVLKIKLRGIEFQGECFESLEGRVDRTKFEYVKYKGQDQTSDLTNCQFNIEVPLKFLKGDREIEKTILVNIQIEDGKEGGVRLELRSERKDVANKVRHGYFEDALIDMQSQLPSNEKIKSCMSCKYSHYSPYGNGMFGGLYCFVKIKERINEIQDKKSLLDIWALADEENKVFNVQEIFDCEEHQFITDKDWNYSNWR